MRGQRPRLVVVDEARRLTGTCPSCGQKLLAYTRAGLTKAMDHHLVQAHPELLED